MLFKELRPVLDGSPFLASLPSLLQSGERVQIHHLNQSARALVAARLWEDTQKNVLIVSHEEIIAEDIWDDLVALLGAGKPTTCQITRSFPTRNARPTIPSAPPA